MMLLSLSTCPWQDSSLSRTRIPLLRLRSADPLCVARNAERSLPSAIRDVRQQNGLRNKRLTVFAARAYFRRCSSGPRGRNPSRSLRERGAIGRHSWPVRSRFLFASWNCLTHRRLKRPLSKTSKGAMCIPWKRRREVSSHYTRTFGRWSFLSCDPSVSSACRTGVGTGQRPTAGEPSSGIFSHCRWTA